MSKPFFSVDHVEDESLNPELNCNPSSNTPFAEIVQRRLSRRAMLRGGIGAAVSTILASSASAVVPSPLLLSSLDPFFRTDPSLGFDAVPVSRADEVLVPAGYRAQAFVPWGTPLTGDLPEFDALEASNSGADQEQQVGSHHDGMHYFPIDLRSGGQSSDEGLLVMNHEYVEPGLLHATGPTVDDNGVRVSADEVRKEVAAHGVSVIHIRKNFLSNEWEVVTGSRYNRRITGGTPMQLNGPARGDAKLQTLYSPDGTMTRGTLNNCANGVTPWGTYLTCEENWAGYFVNDGEQPREHSRYGVSTSDNHGRYAWHTRSDIDEYARFDATAGNGAASDDYRNEPNTYGWIVEIDPFNPDSTPVKHTALGRFAHEGVIFAPVFVGKPVVCYMGDDSRFEYIYRFVSRRPFRIGQADSSLLDEGTLSVARFNEDGRGEWIALEFGENGLTPENGFASQADILLNTRAAADFVGATPMDRPEWGAVNPAGGEVYFTLTNNTRRTAENADGPNPRGPNPYGHIIRWYPPLGRHYMNEFEWDIFLLSGDPADPAAAVDLNDSNMHASPDGLWFDYRGVLWIQTDMSGSQLNSGPFGNNQMLAANPQTGELRRFFVGPRGQEVTGITTTPDGCTMFVNIQHPGEQGDVLDGQLYPSHWPDGFPNRPRSSTVVITRDDGGVIGA